MNMCILSHVLSVFSRANDMISEMGAFEHFFV